MKKKLQKALLMTASAICITSIGAFAQAPSNDECSGATVLTPSSTCNSIAGTTVGSTLSSTDSSSCITQYESSFPPVNSVWYKFTADNSVDTITVNNLVNGITEYGYGAIYINAYSGDCSQLTEINCSSVGVYANTDVDGNFNGLILGFNDYNGNFVSGDSAQIVLSGLTQGNTYYVSFVNGIYYTFDENYYPIVHTPDYTFNICATSAYTSVLPITLSSFTGKPNGNNNLISWSTATEINNKGFELEKSMDGKSFSNLAFIQSNAINGNSTGTSEYNYTDNNASKGTTYYRLKQIDIDGKETYSKVISVQNESSTLKLSVFPNPAKGHNITINIAGLDLTKKPTIIIYDHLGKKVKEFNLTQSATEINLNGLSSGIYTIHYNDNDGNNQVIKLVN